MYLKKNLDIVKKVREADLQGKSKFENKELYIQQNAFDVDLDTPIFRIMEIEHLISDLKSSVLTHVKACKETWEDEYENPLLQECFKEDETGENLTLAGIVDDFYGLSWTKDKNESQEAWQYFSYGKPAVRIKSTPRKLMSRLMNNEDQFFMLHHYIGKVEYHSQDEIINYFSKTHYSHHLDSLGQGAALSLMALRNQFSSEQEIRLLYSYDPNSNDWVRDNILQNGYLCPVPFNWHEAVDEITFSPTTTECEKLKLNTILKQHSVNCTVQNSSL
jgi:hypothetical protein